MSLNGKGSKDVIFVTRAGPGLLRLGIDRAGASLVGAALAVAGIVRAEFGRILQRLRQRLGVSKTRWCVLLFIRISRFWPGGWRV